MCDALAADQGGEVEKGHRAPGCEKPAVALRLGDSVKAQPIKKGFGSGHRQTSAASVSCRAQLRPSLPPTDAGPGSPKSEKFSKHPGERPMLSICPHLVFLEWVMVL
jgi:hypothetical protein